MKLTVIGSGDAFGSGGKFNSCFHFNANDKNFLVDCGASSLVALRKQNINLEDIDYIFITHLHGDHFGGLAFFLLDAVLVSKRSRKLKIIGPKNIEDSVITLMDALYSKSSGKLHNPGFELEFVEVFADKEYDFDGIKLMPYLARHPSGSHSFSYKIEANGKIVGLSGDSAWGENIIKIAKGANLVILECFSYDLVIPYHMNYKVISENMDILNADKIYLTHLGEEALSNIDKYEIDVLDDGMVIEI